ncbi:MAG TPA: hypothetical protein VNA20_07290 [Frankiaceae bacterium]|nr:hypothetical protein [Frankiaceae bacterium]
MVRRILATTAATAGCGAAVLLGSSAPAYAGPICAHVTVTILLTGDDKDAGECVENTSIVTTHDEREVEIGSVAQIDVSLNRP